MDLDCHWSKGSNRQAVDRIDEEVEHRKERVNPQLAANHPMNR